MIRTYSKIRMTRRFLVIFYNMLDIAAINTLAIYIKKKAQIIILKSYIIIEYFLKN